MPHSQPENLPIIVQAVMERKPKRILDLGMGYGNYGRALRQAGFTGPLTGVEFFLDYKNVQWEQYNNIWTEEISANLRRYEGFDVVLLLDVIEHFSKETGLEILKTLVTSNKTVVISTPEGDYPQVAVHGNPLSAHMSTWTADELKGLGGQILYVGVCAIAVFDAKEDSSNV